MAHLQYLPGDPRLVDQLVCELKSKGIFDQFRKECIADVDTRPAYQNLRQRVESSVASFLSRQAWKPDLNKNQLREKLRKHILDGNYLEQGVERIVDQVVNPKVASVFIPQVEDLVYNYYGITRKKSTVETSNGKVEDLLPTDLEAVSPGSVKSNDDKNEPMEIEKDNKTIEEVNMEIDQDSKSKETKYDTTEIIDVDTQMSDDSDVIYQDTDINIDKSNIPLPTEDIKPENIPPPDSSPPQFQLENIELPKDLNSTDIPLPDEIPSRENVTQTSTLNNSDFEDSSSDSSLRRNMSPLTPVRNFDDENSYDAQQAFENDSGDCKGDTKEPNTFRFTIESKSPETSREAAKLEKKDENNLSYQFNNQVTINNFNTSLFEDSSNSHNLQIDYESDANSKAVSEVKAPETDQNSRESKKDSQKDDKEKKSSHKSSHKSRESHRHSSSSKDKRSDSKQSSTRDRKDSKDKKGSKDDKSKPTHRERSRDRGDKKSSRDSSKHSSSHRSSSQKDSKSHRSSSSNKHSSKHSDDKKTSSSSSSNQKEKSEKSSDKNSKDRRSSRDKSHRSDKDRKSSSSSKTKTDAKEREKKEKKEKDDHYSVSGRGNHNRRSTDRDSNDGSSSSKGWSNQPSSKTTENNREKKENNSKSDNTTSNSTSPSDKDQNVNQVKAALSQPAVKPIVRVDTQLGTPYSTPPRLAFVPDVTLKKPKIAANLEEAKQLVKMRKFLDEEQKRMNQEAALLLEFQANVRPNLSQIYSSIPGPELEFACEEKASQMVIHNNINLVTHDNEIVENDRLINDNDTSVTEIALDSQTENNAPEVIVIIDDGDNSKEQADCMSIEQQIENMDKFNVSDTTIIGNEDVKELKDNNSNEETQDSNNVAQNVEESNRLPEYFEITIITEQLSENEEDDTNPKKLSEMFKGNVLKYFGEEEKFNAELEREKFSRFFKTYSANALTNKLYIFNCDPYQEDLIKEASQNFGHYEIVNYHKNGHFKLSKPKNVIKDLTSEVKLPVDNVSTMFSPVKSECSFELSSDYDAKLEEMVNKTTKQEIMEIIMGCTSDASPSKMPTINYCTESNIESNQYDLKRKWNDIDTIDNNNRQVLTSNKIRKLSESEQISSTTGEKEEMKMSNVKTVTNRSRCSSKLKKDGLPKHPRKAKVSNGTLSNKSVENYNSNAQVNVAVANGKIANPTRNKVQRYEVSDLYKPKLHYLSRRNNVN